jgi:Arf-GAP/SH3 domain/ANK repeat/PH domain-containing protein
VNVPALADADIGNVVTISSLTVTNSRKRTVLNVVPDAFPATRYSASRDLGDNSVVEYVQVSREVLNAQPLDARCCCY